MMTMSAPGFQRQPVAGLLVSPVSRVDLVHVDPHPL